MMVSVIKLLWRLLSEAPGQLRWKGGEQEAQFRNKPAVCPPTCRPLCGRSPFHQKSGHGRLFSPTQVPRCPCLSLSHDKAPVREWERKKGKSLHAEAHPSCLSQHLGPSMAGVCLCVFLKFVNYVF